MPNVGAGNEMTQPTDDSLAELEAGHTREAMEHRHRWIGFLHHRRLEEPCRRATLVLGWIRSFGDRRSCCWFGLHGGGGAKGHRRRGLDTPAEKQAPLDP